MTLHFTDTAKETKKSQAKINFVKIYLKHVNVSVPLIFFIWNLISQVYNILSIPSCDSEPNKFLSRSKSSYRFFFFWFARNDK